MSRTFARLSTSKTALAMILESSRLIWSRSPAACPPCVLCASKTASEINLFRCVSFGIWRDLRFSFSLTGFVAAWPSAEQHDEPAAPDVEHATPPGPPEPAGAAYRTLRLPRKHPHVLGET